MMQALGQGREGNWGRRLEKQERIIREGCSENSAQSWRNGGPCYGEAKRTGENVSSHNSDGRKVETRQNVGSAHGFSAICGKNYILCQGWDCRVIIYVSLTCNVVRDTVPSFCL